MNMLLSPAPICMPTMVVKMSSTWRATKTVNEGAGNATVTLTVSSGVGQAVVPNVVGKDASDAANILGQAGFKSLSRTQPSDTVPAGIVISTSPAAGARAQKGSTVTMLVSSGASTTTSESPTTSTTATSTVSVPNVIGDSETQARVELARVGLQTSVNCTTNAAGDGRVTSQDPSAGSRVTRGSTVTISLEKPTC